MWCTKADDFRLQVYRTWKRPSKTHGKKSPLRQFENPLHNGKNDWMRLESSMEVLSPRLLAEPWRLEGWCERAGGNERAGMRVNAVCLQQFHQFIQLVRTCISTRRDTAFVRTFYCNVTAIPNPRCVRSSRQRTGQTRRSPALSCRDERHETLTRKKNKNKNATQYIHRLIYYSSCRFYSD